MIEQRLNMTPELKRAEHAPMRGAIASQMAQTAGGQVGSAVEGRRNQLMDQGFNVTQATQMAAFQTQEAMAAMFNRVRSLEMEAKQLQRNAGQLNRHAHSAETFQNSGGPGG